MAEIEISIAERLDGEAKAFSDAQWKMYDEATYDVKYSKEGFALIAKDGETIVGTATGWFSMGIGYLSELIVDIDLRSQGIGARLLSEFEIIAKSKDQNRLALRTEETGIGLPFYLNRGWFVEATIPNWFGDKTFVQMRKDLASTSSGD